MSYSALVIADEILKIAKQKGKTLTPLQLMKLVYISHGWSFPIRGKQLLGEKVEAWKYGPVIPDLYHATKQYGRNPIPLEMIRDENISSVDGETRQFLENVFDQYGGLTGIALSALTHKKDTPWEQVYEEGSLSTEIPTELIRQHYQEKYDDDKPCTGA